MKRLGVYSDRLASPLDVGLAVEQFPGQAPPMPREPFSARVVRAFAADPEAAAELYISASEIINDFEHWGPVIQANEDGVYDDSTEIVKLRLAYERISAIIAAQFKPGGTADA